MGAMKLADPAEKRVLGSKCKDMMSTAEQIKASGWTPSAQASSLAPVKDHDSSSNRQSKKYPNPQSPSVNSPVNSSMLRTEETVSGAEETLTKKTSPVMKPGSLMDSVSRAVPSAAKTYRTKEPVSTRKRSNRESIILLKASAVNGFKFPPWEKTPVSEEFTAANGAPSFVYV